MRCIDQRATVTEYINLPFNECVTVTIDNDFTKSFVDHCTITDDAFCESIGIVERT